MPSRTTGLISAKFCHNASLGEGSNEKTLLGSNETTLFFWNEDNCKKNKTLKNCIFFSFNQCATLLARNVF